MSQSQAKPPARFGGRYELTIEDEQGNVTAVDHEPWRRCWACGSTDNYQGEAFCSNCGAALRTRTYQGKLSTTTATDALLLVARMTDEHAREVLPTIWDQVVQGDEVLVLAAPDEHTPIELPLEEVVALRIGEGLARLLVVLHGQGVALGRVNPAHLAVTVDGQPRLLRVPNLRPVDADEQAEAMRADLQALAELLEGLTETPRTTQRLRDSALQEQKVSPESPLPTFAAVLSQLRTDQITDAHGLVEKFELLIAERTRPTPLRQLVGAISHTGMVRDHNEDSLLALNLNLNNASIGHTRGLYIVADGMGGHAAGEVASYRAVRSAAESILSSALNELLDPESDYDEHRLIDEMGQAVLRANEAVSREAQARNNDMGTTITMALVTGDRAIVANVGDSRTYLYRAGVLQRISQDHSLVMRLVELGQLAEEDIYTHPQRNAVLRSLGDQAEVEVDLFTERLQAGDMLLLCSDGQWEMTHDPQMTRILETYDDVHLACEKLIEAANEAGGEDNITSILVRFEAIE